MWSVCGDDSNIVDLKTTERSAKTMNTSNNHLGIVTDWPKQLVIVLSNFGQDRVCVQSQGE